MLKAVPDKPRGPACPECGTNHVVPIAYGYPSSETFEAAQRGELMLGGCMVGVGNPTHHCKACEAQFRPENRPG